MNYKKINNLSGWLCFAIAFTVYVMTLEPSVSFWDSGEFIAAAYKLQIVHQPGAPLYLMIAKIFSLFAWNDTASVAFWTNLCSAAASAVTVMFLFWTITALAGKILWTGEVKLSGWRFITIMGSGFAGALAFAFSDSFWFSAVETEVYALSSLCTAVVFWAILKWEAEADGPYADRWLVFIAYMMGLSIGVHLLNLLAIPAIALVCYFRRSKVITSKGIFLSLLTGILILAFIQYGIIQYTVKFAAFTDLFFVNTLGLAFGSGVQFFILLTVISLTAGILYTLNGSRYYLRAAVISFAVLMTSGGGAGGLVAAILILAGLEYLFKIREKRRVLNLALISIVFIIFGYGSFAMIAIRARANPTLNNNHPENAFSLSGYVTREQYADRPLLYGQYFDSRLTGLKQGATLYRKGADQYEPAGSDYKRVYDRNTLFPRMYSDEARHVSSYREWMGLPEPGSPSFLDNIGYLFSYQAGFMYARYFAWNFIGRQNDEQGEGNYRHGNWLSGIRIIDNMLLGGQYDLPESQTGNKAFNRFYFLPFILGLAGLFWHFKRSRKDFAVVGLLFFFTGVAIVLYLNQTPGEPRERNYAYTGSFYAFAIWIGLGVAGIAEFLRRRTGWRATALTASVLGLIAAPVLMVRDGWDDHDRSSKFTARDMAHNYLDSCAPNAILFTFGDNDTYPLWYAQEVENFRPDVRVVNLSLLNADWYIRQMKKKVNQADALPISMPDEKFVRGVRDVMRYQDYQIRGAVELKDIFEIITSDNETDQVTYQDGSKENFLPSRDFKMTIDPDQVIATGTLPAGRREQVTPVMEWTYNKSYVSKAELALLDILVNNNWERPVYFSISMPSENYIGLDSYLYNEGYAYRLLPLKKADPDPSGQRTELINTDVMYANMMEKFKWGNMKKASYLDPESRRASFTAINNFNMLAEDLFRSDRKDEARKALLKCIDVVPDTNYSLNFTIRKLYMADLLYKLNEADKANTLASDTADYIEEELRYRAAIAETKNDLNSRDIQLGAYVTAELVKLAAQNGQKKLHEKLQEQYNSMEAKFTGLLR